VSQKRNRDPKDDGIFRQADGSWRAFIRVGPDRKLFSKRFRDPDTSKSVMRDWRQATKVDVKRAAKFSPAITQTFAEDVDDYLRAVRTMPSYADRERDMDAWIEEIGKTATRADITSTQIRAVLQQWRIDGRHDGKPLSESACNHRRTALMHFFSVLNGKSGSNPCRDVPRFREPDPEPRGLSFKVLQKVFRKMPDTKTKARLMVLAYTGIPRASLMRMRAEDIDYKAKTALVPRRRKGAGTKLRVLPLTPQAIKAFKMLNRFDGWGHFSRASLLQALKRACVSAKVTPIRAYDLRHSFASEAYARTGDIGAVQALLDHADVKMTNRYTLKAVDARVQKAVRALAKGYR
jgi:integrase/recombinase XerC